MDIGWIMLSIREWLILFRFLIKFNKKGFSISNRFHRMRNRLHIIIMQNCNYFTYLPLSLHKYFLCFEHNLPNILTCFIHWQQFRILLNQLNGEGGYFIDWDLDLKVVSLFKISAGVVISFSPPLIYPINC